MTPNGDIRGIASKQVGDFYYLSWFHLFRTKNTHA